MSFLDKVKDKVKGRDIDREIDDAFGAGAYSKRVLEANERMQKTSPPNPNYSPNRVPQSLRPGTQPAGAFSRQPAPAQFGAEASQAKASLSPQRPPPFRDLEPASLPDEEEFTQRRFGAHEPVNEQDFLPPRDLVGLPGRLERKEPPPAPEKLVPFGQPAPSAGTDKVLDNIVISLRDLRAQNNHIIDLLRSIQDRLSRQ